MPNGFPKGDFRIINQDTNTRLFTYDAGYSRESIGAKSSTTRETGQITINVAYNPVLGVGFPGNNYDDLWFIDKEKDQWGEPYGNRLVSHIKVTNGWFCLQVQWTPGDFPLEIQNLKRIMPGRAVSTLDKREILLTPLKNFPTQYLLLTSKEVTRDDIAKAIPFLFSEKVLSYSSEEMLCLSIADLLRELSEKLSRIPSNVPSEKALELIWDVLNNRLDKYKRASNSWLTLWGRGRENVSKWQAEDGYIFLEGQSGQVLTVVEKGESYGLTLVCRGAPNQTWRFE